VVNLHKSIKALIAERQSLLKQVSAVNQALAILQASEIATKSNQPVGQLETSAPAVRRVRPKHILSPEHIAAMIEGRRKKRLASVAAGRALEPIAEPILGQPVSEAPRLVRRGL
jgi:hypothetical protein